MVLPVHPLERRLGSPQDFRGRLFTLLAEGCAFVALGTWSLHTIHVERLHENLADVKQSLLEIENFVSGHAMSTVHPSNFDTDSEKTLSHRAQNAARPRRCVSSEVTPSKRRRDVNLRASSEAGKFGRAHSSGSFSSQGGSSSKMSDGCAPAI